MSKQSKAKHKAVIAKQVTAIRKAGNTNPRSVQVNFKKNAKHKEGRIATTINCGGPINSKSLKV
jgi:hypothetical protein